MNKILHVFWKSNPDLLPEYVDTLSVFYKRIRSFRKEETPHIFFEDLGKLLVKLSLERPDIPWIVVHPVGSYFLDQDALVYHYQQHIDALSSQIFVGGFPTNEKTIDSGKSFFLHVPTAHQMMKKMGAQDAVFAPDLLHFLHKENFKLDFLPQKFLLAACYPDIQQETETFNASIQSFFNLEVPKTHQQRQFLAFLLIKKLLLDREGTLPSPFSYDARKSHVFFFNTELLLPDLEWIKENGRPLDVFVGACAGFLDICNLHAFGYHPQTELVYYDMNPDSILFKKYMWEKFNGDWNQLIDVIEDFCREHNEVEGFDVKIYPHKTEDLKKVFNHDRALFQKTWQDLQKLPKRFIGTDLIFGFDSLLAQLPKDKSIFFSISDVFLAHNELMWGLGTVTRQLQKLIHACSAYPHLVLQGKNTQDDFFIDYAKNLKAEYKYPESISEILSI